MKCSPERTRSSGPRQLRLADRYSFAARRCCIALVPNKIAGTKRGPGEARNDVERGAPGASLLPAKNRVIHSLPPARAEAPPALLPDRRGALDRQTGFSAHT